MSIAVRESANTTCPERAGVHAVYATAIPSSRCLLRVGKSQYSQPCHDLTDGPSGTGVGKGYLLFAGKIRRRQTARW
jgi:hypothetical protein